MTYTEPREDLELAYINRADSRFTPANERRRFFVTTSLIGCAQT